VICLLEIRENETMESILKEVRPDLLQQLDEIDCGSCCGGVVPLFEDVSETLQGYWIDRLNL
jgi:uncharacterized UPF0160 family protein